MMLLLIASLFFSISTIASNQLESSKSNLPFESIEMDTKTDVIDPNEEIISDENESDDDVAMDEITPNSPSEDDINPIEPIAAQNIPILAEVEPKTAFSDKEISLEKQSKQNNSSRTITIKNGIDDTDLAYQHWTGSYSPKKFTVSINGVEIDQQGSVPITIINNELIVSYSYDFGYNIKKARGAYQVTFAVEKDATDLLLTFSWHNDWHVILDKATPQEEETIDFVA